MGCTSPSVLVLDAHERIVLSNPAAERMLRYRAPLGRGLAEVTRDRLAQMVAELLDLARAEAGRLDLRLAPCRLDELVKEAAERIGPTTRQADLLLEVAGTGTGLGLAIAKHLVLTHGGQIWAESPGPGRGSTFRVRLPAL